MWLSHWRVRHIDGGWINDISPGPDPSATSANASYQWLRASTDSPYIPRLVLDLQWCSQIGSEPRCHIRSIELTSLHHFYIRNNRFHHLIQAFYWIWGGQLIYIEPEIANILGFVGEKSVATTQLATRSAKLAYTIWKRMGELVRPQ